MNATQILDQLTQAVTYRDLQAALKSAKAEGYEVCKLNANKEALEVSRNTLVMEISRSMAVSTPEADLTVTQIEESEQMLEESAKAVQALATEFEQAIASQGCPEVLAAEAAEVLAQETVTGTPRTSEEQATVTTAWEASQSATLEPKQEPSASIFNPIPTTLRPIATAKWAWEYASRRAAADTAFCRCMASDALAAASLALQLASRTVAA